MRPGSSPALSARRRRMRKTPARVSGAAVRVEEQLLPVAPVEVGTAAREVAAEGVRCLAPDRYDPFLAALAEGSGRAGSRDPRTAGRARPPRSRAARRRRGARRARGREGVAASSRAAASRRRSTSAGERVRGSVRRRFGSSTFAAGLSSLAPSSTCAGRRSGRRRAGARSSSARARPREAARRRRRGRRCSRPRASGRASARRWARSRRYASTVRGARRAEARARKPSTAGSGSPA